MSDIYNKNAREKALLEEAYGSIYNEGQFWGRKDLVKKGQEEDKARGAVKLVGKTKDGNHTSATLPKGDPKIKELEAQGYKRVSIGDEDAEMEFDERGFVKNTEAGYEREDNIEYTKRLRDHSKFAEIAIEALGMLKDEIHVDGHPEDINVNELTDAHNQLSRALIGLVGEEDAIEIMGGAAQAQAEAGSRPEQFGAVGEYPE